MPGEQAQRADGRSNSNGMWLASRLPSTDVTSMPSGWARRIRCNSAESVREKCAGMYMQQNQD